MASWFQGSVGGGSSAQDDEEESRSVLHQKQHLAAVEEVQVSLPPRLLHCSSMLLFGTDATTRARTRWIQYTLALHFTCSRCRPSSRAERLVLTGFATPGVWVCDLLWLKVYVCIRKVSTDAGLYAFPNLRTVMRGMLDPRCELSHFRNIKVSLRHSLTAPR